MLMAGFDEAHAEGLLDAADICGDVVEASPPGSRVARVLETALRGGVSDMTLAVLYDIRAATLD
jgi:hypothetical protein